MPTISMFFGIIIRMYYAPKEHGPPHIHVYFNEHTAVLRIDDESMMNGKLPIKQTRLVQAWINIHKEALQADWMRCMNGQKPFQIEPLQ